MHNTLFLSTIIAPGDERSIPFNFDVFCIGFSWKTEYATGVLLEVINAESDVAHEERDGNIRRQGPAQQHPSSINCARLM